MLSLLRHLPEPPADFRQRCKQASDSAALVKLAGYQLDGSKLEQLAAAQRRIGNAGLDTFRLGILCNASTDFLAAPIGASGLRYGLGISCVIGDYGLVLQEATNPASRLLTTPCDAVLLAVDSRGLPLAPMSGYARADQVQSAIALLVETRDALKAAAPTTIIFQTLATPPMPIFGSLDARIDGTERAIIQDFNVALRKLVQESPGDLLLDVEAASNAIGQLQWNSPTQWNLAKLQFSQQALPVYADHIARLLGAMRGKSKKCLVLDLDNTVWGGAVGDLGVDGIVLGQGSALGEAFLEVQRTALRLRERGIILAVCSKNNEAAALQPFREHPEMLLKEEHISVFQANWIDKATNLEEIARILDIGVDSLVLLDDNPAERTQVREALGVVAVPELPDDPSLYPLTLLNAGYFDAVSFTAEDSKRADQYQANATRSKLQSGSRDPHAFLTALEMSISFAPFDRMNRNRIVQLINKTNQFNLTTNRYTEAEVEAMEADPKCWTLQVRLVDKFGDNGMISVVIAKALEPTVWILDTWLMSCRVLGRRVDESTMATVVQHARNAGVKTLLARYIPTKKNEMVKDFYRRHGFELVTDDAGITTWRLDVDSYRPADVPMSISSTF